MKEIRFKTRRLGLIVLALLLLGQSAVSAQQSYTYREDAEAAPGPAVYRNALELFGEDLGIGGFKEPQDLFVSNENLVYVADTGNNRIVVLDENLELVRVISTFDNRGTEDKFGAPQGLFAAADGTLYVADYQNNRVVILDRNDQLLRTIENPTDQELIPADFRFRPKKLVADRVGRVYVIAEGVLEGLMEFDEQGFFSGFIGAPRVRPSLWEYFWRQVMTEAQRERSVRFIPTEYSNVDIDGKGFIYATVAGGGSERTPIRRLNPAGEDVLRRTGQWNPMGDIKYILAGEIRGTTVVGRSSLEDIAVWEHGIYAVVDLTRGRIFSYDDNGNLLFAFGAPAFERNAFRTPAAVDYLGDRLLVLDRRLNMITLLQPTDYAQAIYRAIALYQLGDYDGSAEVWREVLKYNPNLDLAYSGIGRALLRQGKFYEAMQMYHLGSDREGYSQALSLYRREWVNEHFSQIMTGLVVFILAVSAVRLAAKRRSAGREEYRGLAYTISENKFIAYLQKLQYALHVIVRPGDGFWDLKHEKRGDMWSASTILAMVVAALILARQYTGFPFNWRDPRQLNIYMEMASVLVPFFLWCGVNLALTSIMDGKGSFRDIFMTTAYALTPIVLVHTPLILVSRVITLDEGAFYYVFQILAVIWAVFLLLVGMSTIHDYSFSKNLFTSGLTVAGIGVVIFLTLLFANVVAQLLGFVDTIWTEITFRV